MELTGEKTCHGTIASQSVELTGETERHGTIASHLVDSPVQ